MVKVQTHKFCCIGIIVFCLSILLFAPNDRAAEEQESAFPSPPPQPQIVSQWERITTFKTHDETHLQLLSDLCSCMQPGVWLTEIRLRETDVIIHGYALGRGRLLPDFISFIRMLYFSDSLRQIEPIYLRPTPHASHDIQEFQLSAVRVFPQTTQDGYVNDLASCPDFFTPLILDEAVLNQAEGETSTSHMHPLQAFEIQELQVTAITMSNVGGNYAYVRTPQGKLYEVAVGTPIGRQDGRVIAIAQDGLRISQQILQQRENRNVLEMETQLPCVKCPVDVRMEP